MRTRAGHECDTFTLVEGAGNAYTCDHGHAVLADDAIDALARATGPAEDAAAALAPAADPGQPASEQSRLVVGRNLDQRDGGCSEAVLGACALAWEGRAITGINLTAQQAQTMVDRALVNGLGRVLGWRQYIFENLWDQQWRWAVRTMQRLFPDTPGVKDLTEDHNAAGLPELAAAHC